MLSVENSKAQCPRSQAPPGTALPARLCLAPARGYVAEEATTAVLSWEFAAAGPKRVRPTSGYDKAAPSPAQRQLEELLDTSLILADAWQQLPEVVVKELNSLHDTGTLLERLVEHQLLTAYQAARIRAGKTFGLMLGNYRVLDRLGSGGMGVVYKGEHVRMRRTVALKVVSVPHDEEPRSLLRFFAETRASAQLVHPHIVAALDAGQVKGSDVDEPVLHYLVMEYVPGKDLEAYVTDKGPLPIAEACALACQVADALVEVDRHHLVHRDIKPSNIVYTPERKAKLLDFGLVHHLRNRLTEQRITMGTIDFMPPEQACDAGAVDIRADIYSLGAVLFWCLTGQTPFRALPSIAQELLQRQTQAAPSARTLRPDIPAALDAVLQRMMATQAADRHTTPQAVLRALMPFCQGERVERLSAAPIEAPLSGSAAAARPHRVLIVDDEREIRDLCQLVLQHDGIDCTHAENGVAALHAINTQGYDLMLVDCDMPEMGGPEVLKRVRQFPPCAHLKVIMLSGRVTGDAMAESMQEGADDYLTKPFSITQLRARVRAALRLKDAQTRSDLMHRDMLAINAELERNLGARDSDFIHARNALTLTLAKLIERRAITTSAHLKRMQAYCRCLSAEASRCPSLAPLIHPPFVQMLECCAPLHDIGMVALPDHILLKAGPLDPEERIILQSHTTLGAETLQDVARQHGSALAFLHMAIDIVRHHHERFDGQGYPDRLVGSDIPLAARIVAVADSYDALRSRGRIGRPALGHAAALQVMNETSGQFDPVLLHAFQRCAGDFERIFDEQPD